MEHSETNGACKKFMMVHFANFKRLVVGNVYVINLPFSLVLIVTNASKIIQLSKLKLEQFFRAFASKFAYFHLFNEIIILEHSIQ